jgi:uncharacterized membrane-anchored protein YjiN (DUF445 family)
MNTKFGDKALREAMLNDPLLRGKWVESKTVHALDPIDHLIEKIGINIVQAVESYYQRYCANPNEVNARAYTKWRFRLHQRLKNDHDTLDAINEARNLGLYDENPGKTFWDCKF